MGNIDGTTRMKSVRKYKIVSYDKNNLLKVIKNMFMEYFVDDSHIIRRGSLWVFEKIDDIHREVPLHMIGSDVDVSITNETEYTTYSKHEVQQKKAIHLQDYLQLKSGLINQPIREMLLEYISKLVPLEQMNRYLKIESTPLFNSINDEILKLIDLEMLTPENVIEETIRIIFDNSLFFRNARNMGFNVFNKLFIPNLDIGGLHQWI
ncbi:hypothetical protein [Paracholeplasma manati]|uniref:hypothetical protein n=1 Tax=Paracholeplasma manati TaxID=591373 RepID=UPI002408567B|nr:hypothetical protein [Paracholeplasma manati]MDG0889649.1 hypothetical protein [Paracholeplasma manati]